MIVANDGIVVVAVTVVVTVVVVVAVIAIAIGRILIGTMGMTIIIVVHGRIIHPLLLFLIGFIRGGGTRTTAWTCTPTEYFFDRNSLALGVVRRGRIGQYRTEDHRGTQTHTGERVVDCKVR